MMFAEERIQVAQIDGAIRLIEMLRDTPTDHTALSGRGALLADDDVTAIHRVFEGTRTRFGQSQGQRQAREVDGTARDTACRRP